MGRRKQLDREGGQRNGATNAADCKVCTRTKPTPGTINQLNAKQLVYFIINFSLLVRREAMEW